MGKMSTVQFKTPFKCPKPSVVERMCIFKANCNVARCAFRDMFLSAHALHFEICSDRHIRNSCQIVLEAPGKCADSVNAVSSDSDVTWSSQ